MNIETITSCIINNNYNEINIETYTQNLLVELNYCIINETNMNNLNIRLSSYSMLNYKWLHIKLETFEQLHKPIPNK